MTCEIVITSVDTMDNLDISLPNMVLSYVNKIIEFYIKDAFTNDVSDIFNYFPDGFSIKSATWTSQKRLQFAFLFYLVNGYEFYLFPIQEYFEDKNINTDIKKRLLSCPYMFCV